MKKTLLLLITTILLYSCGGIINKKITKESYITDVAEIRKEYSSDYTDSDFEKLGAMFLRMVLTNDSESKTYKELLTEIKKTRLDKEAQYKVDVESYNNALIEVGKLVKVDVTKRELGSNGFITYLYVTLRFSNLSDKGISAVKARMDATDVFGKYIDYYNFECIEDLNPKSSIDKTYQIETMLGESKRLDNGDPNKLALKINAIDIVFSDGTKQTVPIEPTNPSE